MSGGGGARAGKKAHGPGGTAGHSRSGGRVRDLIWEAKERHSKRRSGRNKVAGSTLRVCPGPPAGAAQPGRRRWRGRARRWVRGAGRTAGSVALEGRGLVRAEQPAKPAPGSRERLGAEPVLMGETPGWGPGSSPGQGCAGGSELYFGATSRAWEVLGGKETTQAFWSQADED